jgi:glycosyltransferase involved in cell wall biosynthesis
MSGQYHGGGEYAKAVLQRLLDIRKDEEILGVFDPEKWLDPDVDELLNAHDIPLRSASSPAELELLLEKESFDRFYSALPYAYDRVDFGKTELLLTIHGLRPLEQPTDRYEFWLRSGMGRIKALLKRVLRPLYRARIKERFHRLLNVSAAAKSIIVPSNHTKYALLSTFPDLSAGHIEVFYSPPKPRADLASSDFLSAHSIKPNKYFLFVSGGRWVKNAVRGLQALDTIFTDFPEIDHQAVIAGVEEPERFYGYLHNKERFIFLDYVEASCLELLYQKAFALLYPSLNEGFGYPPLEAMKHGTPVLCSATTSVPEVCGDAVLYFNPYSHKEIRNRLLAIINEPHLRDQLIRRSRHRYDVVSDQQDTMLDQLCLLILGKGDSGGQSTSELKKQVNA